MSRLYLFCMLSVVAAAVYFLRGHIFDTPESVDIKSYQVQRGTIAETITETGRLACENTSPVKCQLAGVDNKVVFLIKEGEQVKKGDSVVRFDTSQIQQAIDVEEKELVDANQRVQQLENELKNQQNKNVSELSTANNAVENAKLTLKKYLDCDYGIKVLELKGDIAESQANLDKQIEELEKLDRLVEKGFRTRRQRNEKRQLVAKAEADLKRDQRKLDAFENFEHQLNKSEMTEALRATEQKLREVQINADLQVKRINSDLKNAREKQSLVKNRLSSLNQQLTFCDVKANASGAVKYVEEVQAGSRKTVELGESIRFKQSMFYILNKNKMVVRCLLDDTVIQRAKAGQVTMIKPRSYADSELTGTVLDIGVLGVYNGRGGKGYLTTIGFNSIPEGMTLNPGVEADIEILVQSKSDVVMVPVTAVTEHMDAYYVFKRENQKFTPVEIKLGTFNDSHIEVLDGIAAGDSIALVCHELARTTFPASYLEDAELRNTQIAELLASKQSAEEAPQPLGGLSLGGSSQ